MKTIVTNSSRTAIIVAQLSFTSAFSWLSAQTNSAAAPKVVGHHVVPDTSKWDANQNGRLDGDEMAALQRDKIRGPQEQQEARAKAAIEAGKLDEAARRTRMVPPTHIKQYDPNTNGLIDLDER